MKIINLKSVIAFLIVIAAVMLASGAGITVYGEDNIESFSITLSDSQLDSSDKRTRMIWNSSMNIYEKYSYYNVYNLNNITLTVTNKNGTKEKLSGEEITEYCAKNSLTFTVTDNQRDSAWSTGAYTVTYRLGSLTAEAVYHVVDSKIKSIAVTPMYKISPVFETNGTFEASLDRTGSVYRRFVYKLSDYDYYITVTYTNGTVKKYTNHNIYKETGYNAVFSQPDGVLGTGTYTGKCSVGGISGTFTFTVIPDTIKNIKLYMTDGADILKCPSDGYYDTDADNKPYFKFIYDRTKIRAEVTFTDGSTADYPIGELCAKLHTTLELFDTQKYSHWNVGTVILNARIRGIDCTLPLTVSAGDVSQASITAKSGITAVLSWYPVPSDGYEVSVYENGAWKSLGDVASLSKTISGLRDNTKYTFGVRAFTVNSNGAKIYTARKTLSVTMPVSPVNGLACIDSSKNSITVAWNKNQYASGYTIEKYNGNAWVQIAKTTSTQYTVSNLSAGCDYKIRVRAYITDGTATKYSGYSEITASTTPIINNFRLTSSGSGNLILGWDKSAIADGYSLEILKSGNWQTAAEFQSKEVLSCNITGLDSITEYKVRIRGYIIINNVKYYGAYSTVTAMTKPKNMSDLALGGRAADALRLNWTKNTTADGYIVEQYTGGKWVSIAKITNNSTTTLRISGLKGGTAYKFRMKAYKMYGSTALYGNYSPVVTASTNPYKTAGFKLGGRAADALRLNWTKNASADGYIIEQYTNGKWVRIRKLFRNDTTTLRVSGLKGGAVYKFRIRAYKMDGSTPLYSSYSADVTARTNPNKTAGFKLGGRAADALRLNWTKNVSADGYIIEQYTNGKWVRISKITNNNTATLRISGLKGGTAYKFRIKAYKMSGSTPLYSSYSSVVTARTNPNKTTGFKLGGKAADALRLNWTKNVSADGYIIEQYTNGKWVRIRKFFSSDTTTLRVSGLKSGTVYKFRIKAYKIDGSTPLYSGYSAVLSAATV